MRSFLLGVYVATGLIAAPASAATVTLTKSVVSGTSDWTVYDTIIPGDPPRVIVNGSEIFEEGFYIGIYGEQIFIENYGDRFTVPQFSASAAPFDWIHVSHDLTMTVTGAGRDGTSGSFSVLIGPSRGPLISIASAGYGLGDGKWTSGKVRSVGTIALPSSVFGTLVAGAGNSFFYIYGNADTYHSATLRRNYDYSDIIDLWRFSYVNGTLVGSITMTAGYGGEPEPAIGRSFTVASQVPLPASGLLLGGVLLVGAGLRRRKA